MLPFVRVALAIGSLHISKTVTKILAKSNLQEERAYLILQFVVHLLRTSGQDSRQELEEYFLYGLLCPVFLIQDYLPRG